MDIVSAFHDKYVPLVTTVKEVKEPDSEEVLTVHRDTFDPVLFGN